jgi:hypothetical protein
VRAILPGQYLLPQSDFVLQLSRFLHDTMQTIACEHTCTAVHRRTYPPAPLPIRMQLWSSGLVIDAVLRVGGDEITLGVTRFREQLFNSVDYFL